MTSKSSVKIRCGQCNLPFWSEEQLKKHTMTHKRRKTFSCTYCKKGFVRGERLKMHERTCEKNPERKIKVGKYSAVMQVGGGVDNTFNLLESALGGVFQTWHYIFSDEEQKDLYKSLDTVVKSTVYDLVIKSTGTFKWYLGLKAIFHKITNPDIISEPPPFFRTDPSPSYHKYSDKVWEIVKEQLEKQIDNYERNGSGWVVSRLVSLDVSFNEMDDPLKPDRSKDTSDDEDKDKDEDQ